MGQTRPLFVYFRLFHMTQIIHKLIKVKMECLGLELSVAEWKLQTNALSYGGTL